MIELCADWLAATWITLGRIRRVLFPAPVADVSAPPAGDGPLSPVPGGHLRDTSELLEAAASFVGQYRWFVTDDAPGPYLVQLAEFAADCRDRAAQFRAQGD